MCNLGKRFAINLSLSFLIRIKVCSFILHLHNDAFGIDMPVSLVDETGQYIYREKPLK